jgi:hypothetical protein
LHLHLNLERFAIDAVGRRSIKVTQMAFPESINNTVYANGMYASRGSNPTTNLADAIFADSLRRGARDANRESIERLRSDLPDWHSDLSDRRGGQGRPCMIQGPGPPGFPAVDRAFAHETVSACAETGLDFGASSSKAHATAPSLSI